MKDDTISRQAAIDAAIEAADDWDGRCSKERERFIRDALEELPSARPEQRWMVFDKQSLEDWLEAEITEMRELLLYREADEASCILKHVREMEEETK